MRMRDALQHAFQRQARYNQHANEALFAVLANLTDRARKRDAGSWFGSIHGILNHIIVCDLNWLKRFRALSPEDPILMDPRLDPPNLSWAHDLHEDFAALREDRIFVDTQLCAWFALFPAARYDEPFAYHDSAGVLRHAVSGHAFQFLFTHQIHHRGQISQILDRSGLPNNLADNVAYLENLDR
jgi:uncharacterized damage-inducible protein DinB